MHADVWSRIHFLFTVRLGSNSSDGHLLVPFTCSLYFSFGHAHLKARLTGQMNFQGRIIDTNGFGPQMNRVIDIIERIPHDWSLWIQTEITTAKARVLVTSVESCNQFPNKSFLNTKHENANNDAIVGESNEGMESSHKCYASIFHIETQRTSSTYPRRSIVWCCRRAVPNNQQVFPVKCLDNMANKCSWRLSECSKMCDPDRQQRI